jgi:hypothetical protein
MNEILPRQQLKHGDDAELLGYIRHIDALGNLYFSKKSLISMKQDMET